MGCQFSLFSWLTSKSRNFPPTNFMISSMCCTTSSRLGANIYCRLNTMALFICMYLCSVDNALEQQGPLSSCPSGRSHGLQARQISVDKAETQTKKRYPYLQHRPPICFAHYSILRRSIFLPCNIRTVNEPRALTVNINRKDRITSSVYAIELHEI